MPDQVDENNVSIRTDDEKCDNPKSCDCKVIITDFDGPEAGVAFILNEVYDNHDCNPFCPIIQLMYSFDGCIAPNPNTCETILPVPNPNGLYSFNCGINECSTITLGYGSFDLFLPNCIPNGLQTENISLTYRVSCTHTEEVGGNCEPIEYLSEPITVTSSSPNITFNITNEECGCKPNLL